MTVKAADLELEPLTAAASFSPRNLAAFTSQVGPDRRYYVQQTGWQTFRYRELEDWEEDPQFNRGTCLGLICRKLCCCFWFLLGLSLIYAFFVSRLLVVNPAAGTQLPLSTSFWPFYLPPPHDDLGLKVITTDEVVLARVLRLPSGEIYTELKGTPQPGVTPEMLRWMHANLDAVVRWRGKEVPLYWLLHPDDHALVFVERDDGGHPISASFLEAAGRNPWSPLTWIGGLSVATWPQQSEQSGWRLEGAMSWLPLTTVSQVSWSENDPDGSLVQRVGITTGLRGGWSLFNLLLRLIPLSVWKGQVDHNVCEASIPAQFLPELYNAEQDPVVPGKRAWEVEDGGYDTSFLKRVKDSLPSWHDEGGAADPPPLPAEKPPEGDDSRAAMLPDDWPDLNEFPDLGFATLMGDFTRRP